MKSFAIFGSSSQQFFFSMRGSFQLADILVRKLSGRGCKVDHHLEKCQQKEFIMRSQKSTSSTSRVIVGRGAWARKYTTFGGNKIGDWGLGMKGVLLTLGPFQAFHYTVVARLCMQLVILYFLLSPSRPVCFGG